jgi:hypothetical protein
MPQMEQEPAFRLWNLNASYYAQTPQAREVEIKSYYCPSRRAKGLSKVGDSPDTNLTGPSVPGACSDYALAWAARAVIIGGPSTVMVRRTIMAGASL